MQNIIKMHITGVKIRDLIFLKKTKSLNDHIASRTVRVTEKK